MEIRHKCGSLNMPEIISMQRGHVERFPVTYGVSVLAVQLAV